MEELFLTLAELHSRLARSGHQLSLSKPLSDSSAIVVPTPETIVTVALDLDPTLKAPFRERYFLCKCDEAGKPFLQYKKKYRLPQCFKLSAHSLIESSDYLDGPIRWLFVRLEQQGRIMLWTGRACSGEINTWISNDLGVGELQYLQDWLAEKGFPNGSLGAIVLDLNRISDCEVLWDVAKYVSDSDHDFYLSDVDCKVVYILHHHQKIMISVPDPITRQSLLEDLKDHPKLFQDCSSY